MQKEPALFRMDLKSFRDLAGVIIRDRWALQAEAATSASTLHRFIVISCSHFNTCPFSTISHSLRLSVPPSLLSFHWSALLFKSPFSHRSKAINLLAMQAVGFNHLQTMSDFCFLCHLSDMEAYCMSSTQYFEMEQIRCQWWSVSWCSEINSRTGKWFLMTNLNWTSRKRK